MKKNPGRKERRKYETQKGGYIPGTLGLSEISAKMKKTEGQIKSRKIRRQSTPFTAYYNGPVY